ncbi:MAG: maleylpyruvate isomerase N-terminal domain-containing protein [Saprospiraceae bacterium]|nr:maleylpyruvate isomerase N-terminal domain-containing protein [Saprospiraceae bacterium]
MSAADWNKKTIVPLWNVKDIVGHLLDVNLRDLSVMRDGYVNESAEIIRDYTDLVRYLNRLNASWVAAAKRLSPAVLTDLLEITGKEFSTHIESLNPDAEAVFSVAWAGEETSANWFHLARIYTEKWHHQQQIRLALHETEVLYHRDLYYPYLDTSMRALPHHYRQIKGRENDLIKVIVSGESGGEWFLGYSSSAWNLQQPSHHKPTCEIRIHPDVAWRIFTKGITKAEAQEYVQVSGDEQLGYHILDMLAVMA